MRLNVTQRIRQIRPQGHRELCDKVLLAIPRSATRLDYKGIELCVSHQGIEQQTKHICGYY
jgi:hypothetical protein